MASSTAASDAESVRIKQPRNGKLLKYDEFIAAQIGKTSRQVKIVELAVAVVQLLVLVLGYSLVVVALDHWLIAGGLGFVGRLVAFIGLVAGTLGFTALRIMPLAARRVNPVFAAYAIEQTQPTLKNSIVNFLLLRRRRASLAAPVYEAVERQAATDLAEAPIESAVDHSHLVKIGYVLLALVTFFCLYKLFSPKDPLRTLGRMADPWADLSPPTRVTIADVQPGTTKVFQGETVAISALVSGLRSEEPVTLYYSTADGQQIDQPLAMKLPRGSYRHEATLPADGAGLQQAVDYHLAAGDAKSPIYRIEAVTAPAILVDRVEYEYPEYAEVPPRIVERQGDLQGIEGTRVTITARANVPIQTAYIDFGANGGRDLALSVAGREARGSFSLTRDGDRSAHDSYQIRFVDVQGHENPQPIRHTIEVLADQPPAIEITAPGKQIVEVASNGSLPISLRAADRDFKLRRVTLYFAQQGRQIASQAMVDRPYAGTYTGAFVFQPHKIAAAPLKPGDEIEYWAEARDNRSPVANRTETNRYKIRIGGGLSPEEQQRQQHQAEQAAKEAENKARQNEAAQPDSTDEIADQQRPESARQEAKEAAPDGSTPPRRPDPEKQPAEAMEQILEHQREKQQGGGQSERERSREQGPNQRSPEKGTSDSKQRQNPSKQNQDQQQASQGGSEGGSRQHNQQQQPGGGQKQQQQAGQQGEQQGAQAQGAPRRSDDAEQGAQSREGESSNQQQGGSKGSGDASTAQGKSERGPGQPERQPSGNDDQRAGQQASDDQAAGNQPGQPEVGQPRANRGGDSANRQGATRPGGESNDNHASRNGTARQGNGRDQHGRQGPSDRESQDAEQRRDGNDRAQGERPKGASGGQSTEKQDQHQQRGASGNSAQGAEKQGQLEGESQDAEQRRDGNDRAQGERPKGALNDQGGQEQGTQKQDGNPQRGAQRKRGQGAEEQPQHTDGQGARSQPTGGQGDRSGEQAGLKEGNRQNDQPPQDKATGGDPRGQKGNSGAGQSSRKSNPTPQPQGPNQARAKQPGQSPSKADENENTEEAASPSHSNKESSSQGGDSGDRSGGGKQGGGQKANAPGTGSAGQNTAADQGEGQAEGGGQGDAAKTAGNKVAGEQPRDGQGGQTAGAGREGESGTESGQTATPTGSGGERSARGTPRGGERPGTTQSGEKFIPPPLADQPSAAERSDTTSRANGGDAEPGENTRGTSEAGGPPEPGPEGSPPREAVRTPVDEANLEYKKKATDLVLDSLKDQIDRNQIDPELLARLKWSPDDLRRFVQRWEEMRKAAGEDDGRRRQFEQTLESLNLKRRGVALNQQGGRGDERSLRETRWTNPPPEYAEQFKAYTQGVARPDHR